MFFTMEQRLEHFSFQKLSGCNYNEKIDGPTVKETEKLQKSADKIYFRDKYLTSLLESGAEINVEDKSQLIQWLKNANSSKIFIKGKSIPVPLEKAPIKNLYARFNNMSRGFKDELYKLRNGEYPQGLCG